MNLTLNTIRPVQTQVTPSLNNYEIFKGTTLCLDFETSSLEWWKPGDKAIYASITDDTHTVVFHPLTPTFWNELKSFIQIQENTLIGHHIKFDLHWIPELEDIQCKLIDTANGLFLLDENKEIGLKPAVKRIFGYELRNFRDVVGKVREEVPDPTTKKGTRVRHRQRTIEEVEPEEVKKYVCEDSFWTWNTWFNYVKPNLHKNPALERNFYEIQMPLAKVLFNMERRGVEIDVEAAKELRQTYREKVSVLENSIQNILDRKTGDELLNLDSPKQLDNLLYLSLGYDRPPFKPKRKDGKGNKIESKYQTDKHCLIWLAVEQDCEVAGLLLERRKYVKAISTYLTTLCEVPDGRIRTSFNQTVARTGRLSSSGSINLQNIPRTKEIRNLFIAKKGSKLLGLDLAQAELRVLAHYSQDENLVAAFLEGRDLHWDTATATGLDQFLPYDDARFAGKTGNFSMVYGVWVDTFRYTLYEDSGGKINLTAEQSKEVLTKLNEERFKTVANWKKGVVLSLKEKGFVESIDNRRRRLPDINSNSWKRRSYAERQGINSIVQGSVGDIINRIMANFWYTICSKYQVLQVHDEVVLEVPEEFDIKDVDILTQDINSYYKLTVPLELTGHFGDRWEK